MNIIGITGSSGSGKTTLSKILNEREEVKVIDADRIVKEMSVPGTDYLNAINEKIGAEVFFEDGNLNRKALAAKIYSDNSAREELNKLTFKYVVDEMLARIKYTTLNETNIKIVVIDAPLLFEAGLDKVCDYVVALVADKELKIKRICQRDNIDEKTAESRLNIQNEDEFYTSKADFVIINSKDCDLKNEIEKVLKEI